MVTSLSTCSISRTSMLKETSAKKVHGIERQLCGKLKYVCRELKPSIKTFSNHYICIFFKSLNGPYLSDTTRIK